MKLKITKEQAKLLENLNKNKVLKITKEQFDKIVENEALSESLMDKAIHSKINSINKPMGDTYQKTANELSKGKVTESLWESFINELYGVNESKSKTYENLIKLMEVAGYVSEGKLTKDKFKDKEEAKDIILGGLQKLQETGSAYLAMETIEQMCKEYKENKPTEELREIDGDNEMGSEETKTQEDEIDTITMDVPLFLIALEYSRENAENDLSLHMITQNAVELGKQYGTLTMDNYYEIFGDDTKTNSIDGIEENDSYPMGSDTPDAPFNQKNVDTEKGYRPKRVKYQLVDNDGQIATFVDSESGDELLFDYSNYPIEEFEYYADIPREYLGADEDGLPNYQYGEFEITDETIENYVNDKYQELIGDGELIINNSIEENETPEEREARIKSALAVQRKKHKECEDKWFKEKEAKQREIDYQKYLDSLKPKQEEPKEPQKLGQYRLYDDEIDEATTTGSVGGQYVAPLTFLKKK
jgi:hypothetical protein